MGGILVPDNSIPVRASLFVLCIFYKNFLCGILCAHGFNFYICYDSPLSLYQSLSMVTLLFILTNLSSGLSTQIEKCHHNEIWSLDSASKTTIGSRPWFQTPI